MGIIIIEGDLSVAGLRDGYTVHGSRCIAVVKLAFPEASKKHIEKWKEGEGGGTEEGGARGVVVMGRTGEL